MKTEGTKTAERASPPPDAGEMVPPPIEVHDMTVAYHRKPVLWDIDLVIPEGKLVGITRSAPT